MRASHIDSIATTASSMSRGMFSVMALMSAPMRVAIAPRIGSWLLMMTSAILTSPMPNCSIRYGIIEIRLVIAAVSTDSPAAPETPSIPRPIAKSVIPAPAIATAAANPIKAKARAVIAGITGSRSLAAPPRIARAATRAMMPIVTVTQPAAPSNRIVGTSMPSAMASKIKAAAAPGLTLVLAMIASARDIDMSITVNAVTPTVTLSTSISPRVLTACATARTPTATNAKPAPP